ncbi:uncharacterized protein LOC143286542 isoform X3 [Babylonia areolata]
MAKVYQQIINLTNKPPSLRTDEELEELVPWLRKKSSHLFQNLEDSKIKKLLKEADFRRYRFDDVIIRQGDTGDEFFILVSGGISFHVNSTDDVETMVQKQKQEETIARDQGRPLNRDVFGIQVGTGSEGKTFGELALIYPDCVRNATVISTNVLTDVLVVSKDLYNETLSGFQSKEYEAKEKFVSDCPLFHKLSAKYRKMAAMSLEKQHLKFEDVVVKQGLPVNGLHFLISGQVKIRVDPTMHPTQFPQHFPVGDIADLEKQKARELLRKEMNLERHKGSGKRTTYERRTVPQEGRKCSHRALELCLMGAVDTIGDLEMVLNLTTYSQTVICTEAATIYHLDQRNYDRLVEKKNPQTVDLMRDIVHTKLTLHFSRLADDSIPLYRYVLYTLDEKERESREKQQQQRQQQQARGRQLSTTATATATETQWEIDQLHKGPLVNLYGPGSVFHLIRSKAKERQQRRQRANAAANNNNPSLRFGAAANPLQPSPLGRAQLVDNSRFLYADETSSIADGHIVNLYGYNDGSAPHFQNGHDETEEYYDEDMGYDDYAAEEEEDWATSDMALSNLEERLQQWHNSLTSLQTAKSAPAKKLSGAAAALDSGVVMAGAGGGIVPAVVAPHSAGAGAVHGRGSAAGVGVGGEHCVVRLHRFHFDDENRPKPGNKVYVRGRDRPKGVNFFSNDNGNDSSSPETDKAANKSRSLPRSPRPGDRLIDTRSNANAMTCEEGSLATPKPVLQKRANSAAPSYGTRFSRGSKKSKGRRHQYTVEEYQSLKEELRRRQKSYKSLLPQRSGTAMF